MNLPKAPEEKRAEPKQEEMRTKRSPGERIDRVLLGEIPKDSLARKIDRFFGVDW